ncbi:MAG: isoprenylcysteine carboxylmethyltransferase family protein [Bacteroidetes bacterium]|nr:isoprenylcysteine carboxylmethyltransferase family protein [Bacteroidota bacterium]MBU1371607.1 isoprenylcysteine carboxylmethyltransferase family protein [Bacteroidota bacterium]MBU1484126.1 isoprenylcysteine carboxylmethyltransferase family protein [Bacteroidota bacterium]MBU1762074.1 isoprenylcysteine carboxylmethyltransferase family protein [Bacteroidota bacterium]MBU2046633.1 isoprenylcysteine carboxylmethyltransferase family protein [Bacteroidota bacterium]
MKTKIDHPGVYFPPPLFYVLIFFISIFAQKQFPLPKTFWETNIVFISGAIFVIIGVVILLPALIKFFKTKNTLIPNKPANSLQTSGIYSISRNPMYLGLLTLYTGIAFFNGNLWTFLFIPLVIWVVTKFIIVKEERYLGRAFGTEFIDYCKKVRRWI